MPSINLNSWSLGRQGICAEQVTFMLRHNGDSMCIPGGEISLCQSPEVEQQLCLLEGFCKVLSDDRVSHEENDGKQCSGGSQGPDHEEFLQQY